MQMLTIHRPDRPGPRDFCHGIDGELAVVTSLVCDAQNCGCDRAVIGLNSAKASTTVKVADLELGPDDAVTACIAYLDYSGWSAAIGSVEEVREVAEKIISASAAVAAIHPVGTVLRPSYDRDENSWSFAEAVL